MKIMPKGNPKGGASGKAIKRKSNGSESMKKKEKFMICSDCSMWADFLVNTNSGICRPYLDLKVVLDVEVLDFFMDAAKGTSLGLGGVFGKHCLFAQWEPNYISTFDPSIEYLELLAVCIAVFAWADELANKRIIVFCDNQSVVSMINSTSSKCKNCLILIRKLTLKSLQGNFRVFCRWVKGKLNQRSDLLSRQRIDLFKFITRNMEIDHLPTQLPEELWPGLKLWNDALSSKAKIKY